MNILQCRANLSLPAILAHRLLITDHSSPVSGGVAERLIAPVLKTGRPKGLVSSNLTPSAETSFSELTAFFSELEWATRNNRIDTPYRRLSESRSREVRKASPEGST